MSDLLSIGEIAKIVGVEGHTIRFWNSVFDHIPYIVGRGKRRYYSISAADDFIKIKKMVHEGGMKINKLKEIIKSGSLDDIYKKLILSKKIKPAVVSKVKSDSKSDFDEIFSLIEEIELRLEMIK